MLIAPLAVLATAAGGWIVCLATGCNPHPRELVAAAVIVLIATEAAAVPLWLSRGADQAAMSQAGLVATVLHLFVAIALAGVVKLFVRMQLEPAFVYWLLAMYWVTLGVVAASMVRAVRSAPTAARPALPGREGA